MAIGSVLVDRARLISKQATSERIEGSTTLVEVKGAWFKARLTLPEANEDETPGFAPLMHGTAHGRVRVVYHAKLLCALKDENGDPVEVHFNQDLEVDSRELGRAEFRVMGEPHKIRKKRRVIAVEASLQRPEEREFEELG